MNNYNRFDSGWCLGWRSIRTDLNNLDMYLIFYYSLIDKIKEGDILINYSFNMGMSFEF